MRSCAAVSLAQVQLINHLVSVVVTKSEKTRNEQDWVIDLRPPNRSLKHFLCPRRFSVFNRSPNNRNRTTVPPANCGASPIELNQLFSSASPFRISKATNFRPKQWTTNWIVVKRPFSKSQAQYAPTNNQKAGGKGKLHKIKRKWRWGCGAGWTILSVLDWWLLAAGGWLQWQGTVLRWTPLGVALMAAAQWHFHNRECERKGLPRTAPHWQVSFVGQAYPGL